MEIILFTTVFFRFGWRSMYCNFVNNTVIVTGITVTGIAI